MSYAHRLLLLVLMILVASPALADEGRIPIFSSTTISKAGNYVLTRNLSASSGSIITISASNVKIDLNGFVLDGTGSSSPVIVASGFDGITIRNGTILGGSRGIEINNGARFVIEDLQLSGSIFGILFIDGTEFAVRRNVVRDANGTGIHVTGSASTPTTGTIEDNVLEDCNQPIRLEYVEACAALNNRMKNGPSNGLQLFFSNGCLISGNTIEGGVIRLSSSHRNTISRNVVSNAPPGNIGIDLGGDDNLVVGNLVTQGGSIGIAAGGDRNHLEGNMSNGNSNWGIILSGDDTTYRGNVARNNGGVAGNPPACVAPCSPDFCIYTISVNNSSLGDNRLPGPPAFPACI